VSDTARGRPRSRRAHQAILKATRQLLVSPGYEALTVESVATKASVSRQTVYRWWPTKAALAAEALLDVYAPDTTDGPADTGDVRRDMLDWVRDRLADLADPAALAMIRSLTAAAADRESDAVRLYEQITSPIREKIVSRLATGQRQKQIREQVNIDAAANVLLGVILYQALARGENPPDFADGVIDALFNGLESTRTPRSNRPYQQRGQGSRHRAL
jgi:AcrR family transcriptional regulator